MRLPQKLLETDVLNWVRPCLWNCEKAGKAFGSSGRRRICSQCHCHLLVQINVFYTWVISLHCARYSKLTTVENAKKYFNLALPTWNRLIFMGFFSPSFYSFSLSWKKEAAYKKPKKKLPTIYPPAKPSRFIGEWPHLSREWGGLCWWFKGI